VQTAVENSICFLTSFELGSNRMTMDLNEWSSKIGNGHCTLKAHKAKHKGSSTSACWSKFKDYRIALVNIYMRNSLLLVMLCFSCMINKKRDGNKVVDFSTTNMNENSERCSPLDINCNEQTELTAYFKGAAKRTLPKDE
jgi:hypothetical protein